MQIPGSVPQPAADGTAHPAASPQLVKAANAFEANFLGELLKPLREDPLFGNGSGLGGDSLGSEGSGGSMGTISSLASDALAQAIARQGGLGIARMVLAQLAPVEETASQTAAAMTGTAGPQCGDCAQALIIGQEAAAGLDSGSLEMLGKGNVSPAAGASTRNAADRSTRGTASEQRWGGFESVPVVRAIGSVRK
ncbi:MAG: hypothetical protein ACLQMO_01775 [Acidobacteriaceae bacterium]